MKSEPDPYTSIAISGTGGCRHMVLDRPERHNSQDLTMWHEVADAARHLGENPEVVVVIVSGNGRSFSSGIDLKEFTRPGGFIRTLSEFPLGAPDPMLDAIHDAQQAITALRRAPFLSIAALRGVALGAGMQLALACDVRITADDAQLALLESSKGLLPDLGATWNLPRLVSRERALDLILTGRTITGAEAAEIGIALSAVPAESLDDAVRNYADQIAVLPRTAVAHVKSAVDACTESTSLEIAAAGQAACIRQHPSRGQS